MTTTAELSENSHQGFEGLKAALCLASMDAKSNSASGLRGCLRRKRTGSRCSGKERDETGLDYFGARYLSSALGRWTSPDAPFTDQQSQDPQSWNLYAYTANNPLRFVDVDGRIKEDADGNPIHYKVYSGEVTYKDNEPFKDGSGNTLTIKWQADIGFVFTDKLTPVLAYKATSDMQITIKDSKGKVIRAGGSSEFPDFSNESNCYGTTFAKGQLWIDGGVEDIITDDGWSETSNPTKDDVGVYSTNGQPVHSARVAETDTKTGDVIKVKHKAGINKPEMTSPGPGAGSAWSDTNTKIRYYKEKVD